MNRKNSRFLLISVAIVVVVLASYFVLADLVGQTTGVILSGNVTPVYDEGNFFVNWTAVTNASNYTIYFWVNSTTQFEHYGSALNTTFAQAYAFTNTTEGNYTFHISAGNSTGFEGENSTNISMYIDTTAPPVILYNFTNITNFTAYPNGYNTTDTPAINITVSDAASGVTGTVCLVSVGSAANQTIAVDPIESHCNGTLTLTDAADGNQTLYVWVNDTVGNWGLNSSHIVYMIDDTSPTVTLSAVEERDRITITVTKSETSTCTTDRGTIDDNVITDSNINCDTTFSYTVTCTDSLGNAGTNTTSFTTLSCTQSGSGLPPGATVTEWTSTIVPTEEELSAGYAAQLGATERVRVTVSGGAHHVGVSSLTATAVTVTISSDPVDVTLNVGEEAKVDVLDDGFYDIYVLLNGIADNKADLTVQSIHEEIPEGEGPVQTTGEIGEEEAGAAEEEERNLLWLWILIVVVVLVVIIGGGIAASKKKKQQ